MKILHAPINIAGQLTEISRAERRLGYKSDVLVYYQGIYKYEVDFDLKLKETSNNLIKGLKMFGAFCRVCFRYDVFHFHFGQSLLPFNWDLPIFRLLGKKIVMQYWGSEIIQADLAPKYTGFSQEESDKLFSNGPARRAQIRKIRKMVDETVVGDPALLPFSPKSKVIPKALDLNQIKFTGLDHKSHVLTIVHAPSQRRLKGTKDIIKVTRELKKEGLKFKFLLVEGKTNRAVLKALAKADIIIDDIIQGPYGILGMEAMALGKPVLCRIDPSQARFYRNLPIMSTSPENLYANLKKLLGNQNLREKMSKSGRKYMEQNHDINKAAKLFIRLYQRLKP